VTTRRAKTVAPPRSPERAFARDVDDDRRGQIALWLSLAWLVGFSLFYYSFTLPNNHYGRFEILFLLPQVFPAEDFGSLANLGQRASLIGVAIVIWAGTWGLGHLAMRAISPPLVAVGLTHNRKERGGPSAEVASSHRALEHAFFAMALGMSAVGLLTLLLGLAGLLNRGVFIGLFLAAIGTEVALRFQAGKSMPPEPRANHGGSQVAGARQNYPLFFWLTVGVVVPFLIVMWLGSMTPEADFDVGTYHFEGPKEYFQNGRITFLSHNFYTNFPFLTEMFALLGMVLRGDWYWGALAGKSALFGCAPLTALGLFAAGRRWFSVPAGLLAVVVYLTTPWIDRVSIIALAEGGMTYFLFATMFAAMMAVERLHAGQSASRWIFITGLLAGSGMGCKYTGLMQVVIPAAIGLAVAAWIYRPSIRPASKDQSPKSEEAEPQTSSKGSWTLDLGLWTKTVAIFAAGLAITVGPWLLKNVVFTGNPVYPLAYNIFGGRDWNPELNANFIRAHSPKDHRPLDLVTKFVDVMADNDWSSPLAFALAPLALLVPRGRRFSISLWLLVIYLIVTYWAFTHRIDRFWMPMVPVLSLLAGIGAARSGHRSWVAVCGGLMGLAILYNFELVAGEFPDGARICGYNAFLTDLSAARRTAQGAGDPYVAYLNRVLPPGSKVLSVGDSQVFDLEFPVVYNTVFNPSIFEKWFAGPAPPASKPRDWPLKPSREILEKLHAEGITHIYVDWAWIRRYREPGNYGFTDFVHPALFDRLMADGVLRAPASIGMMSLQGMKDREIAAYEASLPFSRRCDDGLTVAFTDRFTTLSDQDAAILKDLGPSLLTKCDNHEVLINAQVFPVK
jgi:hypothetical protein